MRILLFAICPLACLLLARAPAGNAAATTRTATVMPTRAPAPTPTLTPGGIRVPQKMRAVFNRGQTLGRRAGVFSKIGDSLTVSTYAFHPIGWQTLNLRDHTELEPAARQFISVTARTANAFDNIPLAADNGWTSADVLNPHKADSRVCVPGETPLTCEYRLVRPAVALILFGTNDVSKLSAQDYRRNMTRLITESLAGGVIPVLTTIPPRMQFEGPCNAYNAILFELAAQYQVPLSDYAGAMKALPGYGLSADGVHPSWPPGDIALTADFTPEHLKYGYTVRNLLTLQTLDAVWRQIMQ